VTELSETDPFDVFAFAGKEAVSPGAQILAVSVNSKPAWLPELSMYVPMASQFPVEGQEIPLIETRC
jgi:hypothetical protein